MTRHGRQITAVYNNSGYEHVFTGHYVNETTIVGIQTRLKLADHTTTRMRLTENFVSPDSIHEDWVALDSNSDLGKGQMGVSFLKRAPAMETSRNGTEEHLLASDSPATLGSANDFSPEYEYAGLWQVDGDPSLAEMTRQGKQITVVYDTGAYLHTVTGHYLNATTVTGIQKRFKRSDHTTTLMRMTYTFLSPDLIRADWVTLDSNSDLQKGQTGSGLLRRIQTTPPQAPLIRQPVPAEDTSMKGVD